MLSLISLLPPTRVPPFPPSFFPSTEYVYIHTNSVRQSARSWRHKNTKDTPCPLDAPGLLEEPGGGTPPLRYLP